MTVAELIAELQKRPSDIEVYVWHYEREDDYPVAALVFWPGAPMVDMEIARPRRPSDPGQEAP